MRSWTVLTIVYCIYNLPYRGPHLVAIYNEAYMPLSAHAHPQLMGAAFSDGFPDLLDGIKPYFDKARETGRGVDYSSAQALVVERRGWREE